MQVNKVEDGMSANNVMKIEVMREYMKKKLKMKRIRKMDDRLQVIFNDSYKDIPCNVKKENEGCIFRNMYTISKKKTKKKFLPWKSINK